MFRVNQPFYFKSIYYSTFWKKKKNMKNINKVMSIGNLIYFSIKFVYNDFSIKNTPISRIIDI